MNALSLENVDISFSGVPILKKVNFDLQEGEVHGIAGKNGAGKSTLMKILTGINQIDQGSITVFGKQFQKFSPEISLQEGVAMVYQDLSLVPSLNVSQNIFLSHHPFQKFGLLNDSRAEKESLELLDLLGVNSISPKTLVQHLSVGQAQLVEIAKALANRPKVLILDEPTASLSNMEIQQLFHSINILKQRQISIIYITHYLEDIIKICDRVTILRDGSKIKTVATNETSIQEIVEDMLGNEEDLHQNNWRDQKTDLSKKPVLLELKNISNEHVSDINLKLHQGEIIGLAGLLGSGRTEILQLIYGLDRPHQGELLIENKPVSISHPKDALKHGISLLPEERRTQGLVLDFNIEHNLLLPILKTICQYFLLNAKKGRDLVDYYISYLKVKTTGRKQVIKYLSGGNQQKVVIGKCLAAQSKILLLDDPTFGIDIMSKIEIMKIVKEYATKGHGVIFISSEFKEIANFCDRTYLVKKGQIVKELDNTHLTEEKLLQEVQ